MQTILLIILAMLILSIIVFVHELGHFIGARVAKVSVDSFNIGIGKSILVKKFKSGLTFNIRPFPLGGFVKLTEEKDTIKGDESKIEHFESSSLVKKIFILLLGPLFNLFFAFMIIFSLTYFFGTPQLPATIGKVQVNSSAYIAGLPENSNILAINNQSIHTWKNLQNSLNNNINSNIFVKYSYNSTIQTIKIFVEPSKVEDNTYGSIGITPFFRKTIAIVTPDSPAEAAGLQKGDELISIDGVVLPNWSDAVTVFENNANKKLRLVVLREKNYETLIVTPEKKSVVVGKETKEVGKIGVVTETNEFFRKVGFAGSLEHSYTIVVGFISILMSFIANLFTGGSSVNSLGGPISIVNSITFSLSYGLYYFLYFIAFLSVNIGVVNLLPIPVLDGGNIVIHVLTSIFKKSLTKERVQKILSFGVFLILFLFLFVTINDVQKLLL